MTSNNNLGHKSPDIDIHTKIKKRAFAAAKTVIKANNNRRGKKKTIPQHNQPQNKKDGFKERTRSPKKTEKKT